MGFKVPNMISQVSGLVANMSRFSLKEDISMNSENKDSLIEIERNKELFNSNVGF
jgi:hypothetical protein